MIGRTISHYQITERLGAGGMGEIYKAQDTRLNRTVAIKVLTAASAGTAERRARFLQEARAASALNHPNIVTIHDIVSEGDTEFLVMEFVAGKTLDDVIPKGGLPMPLVLAYAVQIADGLEAAHGAGIVHRDLKPANVMVAGQSPDGSPGLVKLLDFGLAKLTSPAEPLTQLTATLGHAPLTVEGSILGTLSYMSPEQAEGKPVDARSDIFAFGSILHEMVTGERAFAGDSTISTLTSILRDEVRPLTQVAAGVPPALESIVQRCLRKNRDERWPSIGQVRVALARLKQDSDSGTLFARPASPAPPPSRRRSRLPWVLAGGALALAGMMVLAGLLILWAVIRHRSHARPTGTTVAENAGTGAASVSPKTEDGVLTNDGILRMVDADVPTKLILDQIRASRTRFDLSTSEIIRLTEADVPAEVIAAMRAASQAAPAPPAANVRPAPGAAPGSMPAAGTALLTGATSASGAAPGGTPAPTSPALAVVTVADGAAMAIRLAEDVPVDAPVGTVLHFAVEHELRAGNTVVVAEGATVTGEIVQSAHRKLIGKLIGGKSVLFRLKEADTVAGGKLAVRATPLRRGEDNRRAIETAAGKRSKELAAGAGAEYIAYVDSDQTVSVRK